MGVTVFKLHEDDTIEDMLKRFKRKMKYSGILQELRKKEYYISKGEERRMKKRRIKTVDGKSLDENNNNWFYNNVAHIYFVTTISMGHV